VRHLLKTITVLAFFLNAVSLWAQQGLPKNQSWGLIVNADDKTSLVLLREKAAYNMHMLSDQAQVDSICLFALKVGVNAKNQKLYEEALSIFFEYVDLHKYFALANSHVLNLINSASAEKKWLGYYYASKAYTFYYQPQAAYDFATNARAIALQLEDNNKLGLSIRAQGRCRALINDGNVTNKYEALSHFLEARDVFLRNDETLEQARTTLSIASFFHDVDAFSMAMQYITEAELLCEKDGCNDTLLILDIAVTKTMILASYDEEKFAKVILEQIQFMRSRGISKQNEDLLATYRTYLINHHQFKDLYVLYFDLFPDEFEKIKASNLELFYRMKAYFSEVDTNFEEANKFWILALDEINNTPNRYKKTNSYLRFAEYNLRINNLEQALANYHMAWDTSEAAQTDFFSIKAAEGLQNTYLQKRDFEQAIYWQELKFSKQRIKDQSNEKDALKLAEVEQVATARLKQMTFELNTQRKRLYLMLTGFAIFLGLAGINFYQYRQTRFQKERSDELLLNILPKETANELKQKGRTTALRYNNVTVLFADIVGFSTVAETLEPGPLVAIIDSYFRAFDEICTVYGLEKIKTIGDAYVAVAGLPKGNLASPADAIMAGLSMQRATEKLNDERGAHPFHLRLGLNTGDVVAGVVGSLKFQFDIWGDAVNIAARMEQYGEAGKVNISESTYQLVKDHFECTPRGKIAAKNKGDLDMYFVEAVLPKKQG
jgi:class 3 adenylate cyclase